jgi:hypothetical protein
MTNVPVLGGSPVAFTDPNGNQREIPLSQLYFDSNGINATGWKHYNDYKLIIVPWLAYLVAQNLLSRGPVPPGQPALVISARETGVAGNAVSVTFANPTPNADPNLASVNATVAATQSWSGLTAESLAGVLGTGAGTGSQPGLVFLKAPPPAAGTMPKAGAVSATGTGPVEFDIPKDGSGTAFTLQPLFNGAHEVDDTKLFTVTVGNIDTTNKSFSLMVSWTKSPTAAVSLHDLVSASANPFAYLVSFAAPVGGLIGPPNAGTISLQGGVDSHTSPSVIATATALIG